ncbi:RICIN domain-containing protein [Kitasatospora azatica]|uniref:RICIN domain-containing protein n=1 Tax=Kitasatospora azatica TaxID=58347 RepID=UPI00055DF758|nr:RICIN domain-containing protein [Kitasatospora azatica]
MRTFRPLAVPVALGLAACALAGTTATAHAATAAPVSGNVYTLANAASSDELMDVQFGSTAPGAPVIQYHSNNGANQEWLLTRTSSGAYTIRSAKSGLCLNSAPNPQTSAQLVQNPCNGTADQQWNIQPVNDGSGTYTLANVATGLLADDTRSSTADANPIIQWPSNGGSANQRWRLTQLTRVGTYAAGLMYGGPSFTNQSIRMVAHTTVAGSMLSIRLSNLYGTGPLTFDAVDIAQQSGTPGTAVAGTHHTATFNGSTSVTIPAGKDFSSDPIPMVVAADADQLVSVHLPGTPTGTTWHSEAAQTTWVSTAGNHVTDDGTGNYPNQRGSWYFLEGLDVTSRTAAGTLVCVGDSITDGAHSTWNANHRWPDYLARRMNSAPSGPALGVVEAGIGSNRVLTAVGGTNPSLVSRFDHDVLGQPNVKDVILLEGINDIGGNTGSNGSTPLTAADLEDGMLKVIDKANAAGVKIFGGTILPYNGAGYYTPYGEQVRKAVNEWIRTGGAFDGVIDFDKATQDPGNSQALKPAYDSGDHLHPNDAGYQAMANAVDLALLAP